MDQGQLIPPDALPRGDRRQEPGEKLPVAARPPMLPMHVGQHARGVIVDDLAVAHKRGSREEPFEEVVGEQSVFRNPVPQCRGERVNVVESLARVDALAEKILINIGNGSRVWIDAGVPRVNAREERTLGAREGHADARLKNAVTFRHPSELGVEARPVERMEDGSQELPRRVPREPGVPIEGDRESNVRQDGTITDHHRVARVLPAAKKSVEFFDLSALSLPPHPAFVPRVPEPAAMEEIKPVASSQPRVERLDALAPGSGTRGKTAGW